MKSQLTEKDMYILDTSELQRIVKIASEELRKRNLKERICLKKL